MKRRKRTAKLIREGLSNYIRFHKLCFIFFFVPFNGKLINWLLIYLFIYLPVWLVPSYSNTCGQKTDLIPITVDWLQLFVILSRIETSSGVWTEQMTADRRTHAQQTSVAATQRDGRATLTMWFQWAGEVDMKAFYKSIAAPPCVRASQQCGEQHSRAGTDNIYVAGGCQQPPGTMYNSDSYVVTAVM